MRKISIHNYEAERILFSKKYITQDMRDKLIANISLYKLERLLYNLFYIEK